MSATLLQRIASGFPFGMSRNTVLEMFADRGQRSAAAKRLGKLIEFDAVRESLTINGKHDLVDLRGRGLIGVQLDSRDIRRTMWKRLQRLADEMGIETTDKAGHTRPVRALRGELEEQFPEFKATHRPTRIAELTDAKEREKDHLRKQVIDEKIAYLAKLKLPALINQESIVRGIIENTEKWLEQFDADERAKWKNGVPPLVLLDAKIVHGSPSFDILLSVLYRDDAALMAFTREVVQWTPFVKQTETMSVAMSIGLIPIGKRDAAYVDMNAIRLTRDFLVEDAEERSANN